MTGSPALTFKNINNAMTLIESAGFKMIFDPWVVGNLYQNAWSPYPKQEIQNSWFENITHVFISHIHSDHWDIETMKRINRDASILIPGLQFNHVIGNTLKEMGFLDINYLTLETWVDLTPDIQLLVIPPMNGMAQELEFYMKMASSRPAAIDTGVILRDNASKSTHIILGDNTPYDTEMFKALIKDISCSSFWFPYNGFAQDYPICYDNLSLQEKKQISLDMCIKREKKMLEAISIASPKVLVPHSSDFMLNGKRSEEFVNVHSMEFLDKFKYSERISRLSSIPSFALYGKDQLCFYPDGSYEASLLTTDEERTDRYEPENLVFPQADQSVLFIDEIKQGLKKLSDRIQKLSLDVEGINEWLLIIKTENNEYLIDLLGQAVNGPVTREGKKILTLITSENNARCLLQRKLHWNNAEIGQYLDWERYPNEFNKNLYDCLNFFHL